jgi:hypothetical protein
MEESDVVSTGGSTTPERSGEPDLVEGVFCNVRPYGVLREHEGGPRREPEACARPLAGGDRR